jgi:hypothetical protein
MPPVDDDDARRMPHRVRMHLDNQQPENGEKVICPEFGNCGNGPDQNSLSI